MTNKNTMSLSGHPNLLIKNAIFKPIYKSLIDFVLANALLHNSEFKITIEVDNNAYIFIIPDFNTHWIV